MKQEARQIGHSALLAEHDLFVLTSDLSQHHLRAGDVGTIVHIYADGNAYEAEFARLDGEIIAVATVEASQARPVTRRDVAHARLAERIAA